MVSNSWWLISVGTTNRNGKFLKTYVSLVGQCLCETTHLSTYWVPFQYWTQKVRGIFYSIRGFPFSLCGFCLRMVKVRNKNDRQKFQRLTVSVSFVVVSVLIHMILESVEILTTHTKEDHHLPTHENIWQNRIPSLTRSSMWRYANSDKVTFMINLD